MRNRIITLAILLLILAGCDSNGSITANVVRDFGDVQENVATENTLTTDVVAIPNSTTISQSKGSNDSVEDEKVYIYLQTVPLDIHTN